MLAPQSEANVCRRKRNFKKSRLLTAQDTKQKLGVTFEERERKKYTYSCAKSSDESQIGGIVWMLKK